MYRGVPRLRASSSSIMNYLTVAQLRKKASNSVAAVQDTFYSTKDIFERHKVVFTISTSIASVATAWAGYTLRHLHESKVEQKLESIEKAMKSSYHMEDPEFKKLVSGTVSFPACVATAGTSMVWVGVVEHGIPTESSKGTDEITGTNEASKGGHSSS
ncbi:hypothetical protein DH2020_022790 [Rehmannia glutinosa]|uniref:Uncharacterized protein n=1 Tax=Rehmannia glutinosa TaxID=99300 RepID=A0ABR0W489_REHGL